MRRDVQGIPFMLSSQDRQNECDRVVLFRVISPATSWNASRHRKCLSASKEAAESSAVDTREPFA